MPEWQEAELSQLIKKAQAGDSEAYGDVYDLYAPVIFRFLFSHLDDRMDAEDLTEEVFLRAWRSLADYQEQGVPFVAFLFRIARNALIDHYRRSHRTKSLVSIDDEYIGDYHPDPAEETLVRIERNEVRLMLSQLKEEYRTVLTLRFLGDLSPEETAHVMGKSSGAVRVLQHRALGALRKLFDHKG